MSTLRPPRRRYADPTESLVLGSVVLFAGVVLGGVGLLQALTGVAALSDGTIYRNGTDVLGIGVTAWGWTHLVIGVVAMIVSVGIVVGQAWGIVGGIALAVVSAVSSFLFLPRDPAAAATLLVLDALVLWALCACLRQDEEYDDVG